MLGMVSSVPACLGSLGTHPHFLQAEPEVTQWEGSNGLSLHRPWRSLLSNLGHRMVQVLLGSYRQPRVLCPPVLPHGAQRGSQSSRRAESRCDRDLTLATKDRHPLWAPEAAGGRGEAGQQQYPRPPISPSEHTVRGAAEERGAGGCKLRAAWDAQAAPHPPQLSRGVHLKTAASQEAPPSPDWQVSYQVASWWPSGCWPCDHRCQDSV